MGRQISPICTDNIAREAMALRNPGNNLLNISTAIRVGSSKVLGSELRWSSAGTCKCYWKESYEVLVPVALLKKHVTGRESLNKETSE